VTFAIEVISPIIHGCSCSSDDDSDDSDDDVQYIVVSFVQMVCALLPLVYYNKHQQTKRCKIVKSTSSEERLVVCVCILVVRRSFICHFSPRWFCDHVAFDFFWLSLCHCGFS
jgi:hypothetical protein